MGLMCSQLDDMNKSMNRFRRATVFELDELEHLIKHKGHLSALNKWLGFLDLADDKQIREHEKYFTELLK